jgi:hypothetical protein
MSVGFSQKTNIMSERVESNLRALDFDFCKNETSGCCYKYNLKGGRHEHLRFLGQVRPPRLLAKFDPAQVGTINALDNVTVEQCEPIGLEEVVGLTTSTKTFIAEGFASHNSEYEHQRPSCEYMIGFARGRGIKVILPKTCDLLQTRFMYGYEDDQRTAWDARVKEIYDGIIKRKTGAEVERNKCQEAVLQYIGAMDAIQTLQRIHV